MNITQIENPVLLRTKMKDKKKNEIFICNTCLNWCACVIFSHSIVHFSHFVSSVENTKKILRHFVGFVDYKFKFCCEF